MISLPIPLPKGYVCIVDTGDRIETGQILAQTSGPNEELVNVPEHLDVSLSKAPKYILKNPGDSITEGDVIAIRKNFFGKTKAAIISEVAGTVIRYERNTGNLVVTTGETENKGDVISPVDGMVELCNNKEIVIHTDNAIIGTKVITGTRAEGELYIMKASFNEASPQNMMFFLDKQASGKIVLGETFTRDVIVKGSTIGVSGFIAKNIPDADIDYLQDKNITIPVIEVDEESIAKLKKLEGVKVTVDPQANIILL